MDGYLAGEYIRKNGKSKIYRLEFGKVINYKDKIFCVELGGIFHLCSNEYNMLGLTCASIIVIVRICKQMNI